MVFSLPAFCIMISFCLVKIFKALASSLLGFGLILQHLILAQEELTVSSNLFFKILRFSLETSSDLMSLY